MWSICLGRGVIRKAGDKDSGRRRGKGKQTTEVVEDRYPIQTPEIFQLLSSPSNRVWPRKHTLIRESHLLQFCWGMPDTGVIEEGAKLKNAGGNFGDRKAELRVKTEDVADEFISFRRDWWSPQ